MTKNRMRKAGQYCVNVYRGDGKREMLFEKMYYAGMLKAVPDTKDFYVLTQDEQYQENTGLKLDVELGGMMIF